MRRLPFHQETLAVVDVGPTALFTHLDDHLRLSAHMTKRSWMMAGSKMFVETDGGGGREVGSAISMHGRVLGIRLALDEIITERQPPSMKVWETIGEPSLLVIGAYRMGFEIAPVEQGSRLRAFIDYAKPSRSIGKVLGWLAGDAYARWCTGRMARDARAAEMTEPARGGL